MRMNSQVIIRGIALFLGSKTIFLLFGSTLCVNY